MQLPWKRDDDDDETFPVKQSEFPPWVENKEYTSYYSPTNTFLGTCHLNVIVEFRETLTFSLCLQVTWIKNTPIRPLLACLTGIRWLEFRFLAKILPCLRWLKRRLPHPLPSLLRWRYLKRTSIHLHMTATPTYINRLPDWHLNLSPSPLESISIRIWMPQKKSCF